MYRRMLALALVSTLLLGMGLAMIDMDRGAVPEGIVGDGRRYSLAGLETADDIGEVMDRIFSFTRIAIPLMESAPLSRGDSALATDYSRTNVQVMGIDEPDVVKTDGKYLYMAVPGFRYRGYYISIYSLGERPSHISTIRLINESVREIILAGDRLVAFSEPWIPYYKTFREIPPIYRSGATSIRVFDISDPWSPRQTVNITLHGVYIDARLYMGRLYIFTYIYNPDREVATELMNSGRIYLNSLRETKYPGLWGIYVYNILDDGLDAKYVGGSRGNVYMTYNSIYLVGTVYRDVVITPIVWRESSITRAGRPLETEIVKIRITEEGVEPYKSIMLEGLVGNRLRLDEYRGYLRVAVHLPLSGEVSGWETAIYILDSESLTVVGYLGELGKGEMLYGVRFLGRYAYLVTFRVVDPFYVVDLGDPRNPRILGELKIPGFSTLLQPLWDGLVLGVGYNATLDGALRGLKASIFDVSDPLNPVELVAVPLDADWSEALYDINALTLDPRRGIALIPMKKYMGIAYEISTLVVRVDQLEIETISYRVECSQSCFFGVYWVRSIYSGGYLYLIGMDRIGVFTYPGLEEVGIFRMAYS